VNKLSDLNEFLIQLKRKFFLIDIFLGSVKTEFSFNRIVVEKLLLMYKIFLINK